MIADDPIIPNIRSLTALGADAVAGTLHLAEVALGQTTQAITANTTYAEMETGKATYTGYAVGVLAWSPATMSDDGYLEYLGSCAEFRPADAVTPNGIYYMYMRNAGHTDWIFAAVFPNPPIPMESALNAMRVTIRYRPQNNSFMVTVS